MRKKISLSKTLTKRLKHKALKSNISKKLAVEETIVPSSDDSSTAITLNQEKNVIPKPTPLDPHTTLAELLFGTSSKSSKDTYKQNSPKSKVTSKDNNNIPTTNSGHLNNISINEVSGEGPIKSIATAPKKSLERCKQTGNYFIGKEDLDKIIENVKIEQQNKNKKYVFLKEKVENDKLPSQENSSPSGSKDRIIVLEDNDNSSISIPSTNVYNIYYEPPIVQELHTDLLNKIKKVVAEELVQLNAPVIFTQGNLLEESKPNETNQIVCAANSNIQVIKAPTTDLDYTSKKIIHDIEQSVQLVYRDIMPPEEILVSNEVTIDELEADLLEKKYQDEITLDNFTVGSMDPDYILAQNIISNVQQSLKLICRDITPPAISIPNKLTVGESTNMDVKNFCEIYEVRFDESDY